VDGLEWRRSKWGRVGRRYYRIAESLAVRWSDEIIADAGGIADYYRAEFSCPSRLISYGAPRLTGTGSEKLAELGLASRGYHLVVARFEPENHVLEIVRGYVASSAALPLAVVGSAPYSDEYTALVRAAADERVILLGGVWDQELLDQLYAHAASYLHGHSVGGTNPSLLRAAGAGTPVIAFDTAFNREVAGVNGEYFAHSADVARLVERAETDADAFLTMGERLAADSRRYDWDEVAREYESLCRDLAEGRLRRRRPSGRRSSEPTA
jgi:glycosyltransferase involved in cell wall biosynthesis